MLLSRALIESVRERVADASDIWQTMDVELDHSLDLLLKAAGCDVAPMVYFSTPCKDIEYLGLGQWAVFNNQSAKAFLSQTTSKDVVLMGGQAFDSSKLKPGMPAEWWVLPVAVIIQTPKKRAIRVMIPPNLDDAWTTIETILLQWVDAVAQPEHHGAYTGVEHRPKKNEWLSTIDDVKSLFQTTGLEKVVMARESQFVFDAPLNPFAMMAVIQRHGPELHHFVMRFSCDEAFIGGTPERLFEINDGGIVSDAIAGTIRNDAGATELLTRHKDASEHRYVSDFILRAMQGLCDGSITFKNKPRLLTLRVISHLMQTFKGVLRPGVGPFDAMAALHPTPAVAGTPTNLAMGAIAQLEPFSRKWYAGPMGVVSASQSTVVVAIRSGLVKESNVTLFAGAGIVAESDANSEWDELNAKISGFEALFRS